MSDETAQQFDEQVKAWLAWLDAGEPGDCPMCGTPPGQAHRRNFCYGSSPEAGRPSPLQAALEAPPPDEAAEAMRPWEPYLIDLRWIRWIIADFMGLEDKTEVDKAKVEQWLADHGQDKSFAVCTKCGAEAVHPFRERFEAEPSK